MTMRKSLHSITHLTMPCPYICVEALLVVLLTTISSFSMVAGQDCEPQDCIASQWLEWSPCSESCGEAGIRARTRTILQHEFCGGKCDAGTSQEEPCNRRCCPKNCVFSEWTYWSSCQCYADRCPGHGKWRVCYRFRKKQENEACGGYCDNQTYEELCDIPCCYKDCILGSWQAWEPCEARCESPGTKTRYRRRIQEPGCGGERCTGEVERRTCQGGCCPVDCVLGVWSEWSSCPAVCGVANITRTRFIAEPTCGGAVCNETDTTQTKTCEVYSNVDCKVAPWSEWTPCVLDNGFCGRGSKSRSRKVLIEPECRGQICPNTTEIAVCYGDCCLVDCEVGEWSAYGHCSTDCGTGLATRTRSVLIQPECGGTGCPNLSESVDCEVTVTTDCRFTQWSSWSACSNDCGEGQQMRSRTLLTPAYCDGQCLNEATEEVTDCESYSAKTDCMVSEWTIWGECVRDCDTGSQSSSRTILEIDQCGGIPCEGTYNLTRTRACHEKCSQRCNQGLCSCDTGYTLHSDGHSCEKVNCGPNPSLSYCGPGTEPFDSCRLVSFDCKATLYEDVCDGKCFSGWVLKGSPRYVECEANGEWSHPDMFCGLPNSPPQDLDITSTKISELLEPNDCFARLSTETLNDDWDSHSYSIQEDPSGYLKISGDRVCVKSYLDFEESPYIEWNATIRSTDLDGLFLDKTFTFIMENENDPPRSALLQPNTIAENSPYGTEIGCFTVEDDDVGQTLTVIMLSDEDFFTIFEKPNSTFCLMVNAESELDCPKYGGDLCKINFEKSRYHYIGIMVTDDAPQAEEAYFEIRIEVTDVNEPVTGVTFHPANVVENVEAGKDLLTLSAEDDDKGTEHNYEILNDISSLFIIEGNKLRASQSFDYERNPLQEYTLTIKATDSLPPMSSIEETITFGIEDLNEKPQSLTVSSVNSLETYPLNEPQAKENIENLRIGTVSVIDPDHGDSIDFTVNDTSFTIGKKHCTSNAQGVYNFCSGELSHSGIFDFETAPVVPILITASDKAQRSVSLEIEIAIIDVDDPPTDILIDGISTNVILVPENGQDLQVAVTEAVDEDKDDTHTYFLSGQASSLFVINGNILKTRQGITLDYESYSIQSLTITAIDQGRASVSRKFNIEVTDVNEPPTTVNFSTDEVLENSEEGTLVSVLSAKDPDNAAGTQQLFSYELLDDSLGRFQIKDNQLLVKTSDQMCGDTTCTLDYERQRDLLVQVKVTDDGEPSQSTVMAKVISVLDANDPPHGLKISSSYVRENKNPGSIIGALTASDQDEDVLSFTLKNHTEEFEIIEGNQLVQRNALNFETKKDYFIQIQVADSGAPVETLTDTIKITVTDANEAPSFDGPDEYSIPENMEEQSIVAKLSILDPDDMESVTLQLNKFHDVFMITNVSARSFQNEGGTLIQADLVTNTLLDYEKLNIYDVGITMKDSKGLEAIHQIRINIQDTNDLPENILLDGSPNSRGRVEEGKTVDIGDLSAIDQESQQSHTFHIKTQPGNNFAVTGNKLKVTSPLDAETYPVLVITIEVTDNGIPPGSFEKNFTFVVDNVNEPPSSLAFLQNQISENSIDGTEVGLLLPDDPDSSEGFDFVLLDDANGLFRIDGYKVVAVASSQCTVTTQSFCPLNYESHQFHSIKVMVTDQDFPPQSATFDLQIEVLDGNDSPTDIKLDGSTVEELAPVNTVIGSLSVSDEDIGQDHTFSLKDDSEGAFKIGDDGVSIVKGIAGRLKTSQVYSVVIIAEDSGQPPASVEKRFYISVTGVSEAPKNLKLTAKEGSVQVDETHVKVPESSALVSVAEISAQDNDLDQTISFSLLENPEETFGLGENVNCNSQTETVSCGVNLVLLKELNFEHKSEYLVTVLASDSGNGTSSKSVLIEVTDVAEAPTDIMFSKDQLTVFENSQSLIVGKFTGIDEDKDDSHSFSLLDDGKGAMAINAAGTLSVKDEAQIDYETASNFGITVEVTDLANNSFNKSFSVDVLNVNEKPTSISLSQNTIAEGSTANTIIGQFSTSDPDNEQTNGDSLQSFQYFLRDDAEGRFYLDGPSLMVSAKGAQCTKTWCGLNFEADSFHEVEVQVIDSGTPSLGDLFTVKVTVTDENDAPLLLDIAMSQLNEDMGIGEDVVLLSATDEDAGQDLIFSIVDNGENLFKIEGNKLILNESLDFEETDSVSVTVSVTDNGAPPQSVERTYNFNVMNVEEKPSSVHFESVRGSQAESFAQDQPVIRENLNIGTLIGQLVVIDPDRDEEITVIISGDQITADVSGCLPLTRGTRCVSSLLLEKTLDYEKKKEFPVSVSVIDKTGNKLTKDFQIKVKDQNDPPEKILIFNEDIFVIEVNENEVDQSIAVFTVIDEDIDQNFTIEVKGSSQFYIVADELMIGSAAQLDHERIEEINLRIKATDNGVPSLSIEKEVLILVKDLNEAPTKTSLTRDEVLEDSPMGTEIGSFFTTDPDNQVYQQQTFTYELTENEDELFMIDGSDLKVQKAALDFEEKAKHTIKVRVTDTGEPPMSSEFYFELSVIDRNDPPSDIELQGFAVAEDADRNTPVGILSAKDPDKGQAISFTIPNSDHMTVVNGSVVVNGELDFETEPNFIIEVIASDDALPPKSVSKTFTITVLDANEAPTKLTFAPESGKMEIDERTEANTLIGVVRSFDVDRVDRVDFTLTARSSNLFRLDNSEANCSNHYVPSMESNFTVCAINVFLVGQVLYSPHDPSLILEVTTTDKGDLTLKSKWEISVNDVNDAPYNITIKNNRHEVLENRANFQLGSVECFDPDIGQELIIQVLTHWDIFKVNKNSVLYVAKALDAEKQSEYELTLRCIDSGSPEGNLRKTFNITVVDVNEAPNEIILSHDQVPMTAQDGDTVAFISVTDPDNEDSDANKQQHSCSLTKDASHSFKINDETKMLQVNGSVPVQNESVSITIHCLDDGTPPLGFTQIFKIMITETADVPKEIVLKGNNQVMENSINEEIGTFAIINQLTGNEIQGTFVFEDLTILEASNDLVSVRGNKLYVDKAVDFETLPSLSGSIQGKGKDSKDNDIHVAGTFKLSVLDVNEIPTQILIYGGGVIRENLPEGTVIGKLSTVDPEPYQEYSYEIISVTFGLDISKADTSLLDVVALDRATLKTGPKYKMLDFETVPTLSVVVQTTDSGFPALSLNYTVRIVVQDANDAPTNISLDSYEIKENSALKMLIGRLIVEDPDQDQLHHCVVNNLQDVPFNVENSLDLVVSKEELDFEAQRTYVVDLTCEDEGKEGNHLKVTKALVVKVLDVNEPPYNISLSKLEVEEENSVGDLVAQISATDPDSREVFFSVEENNSNFFIRGNNSLVAGRVFDFEKESSYTVTIKARDDSGLASTFKFSIQVTDKNEKPTSITLTSNVITENAERGSLIGHIQTEDPDQRQAFSYTLTALLSTSGQFVIRGDRLEVGDGKLDFEASNSHRISITSQDNGQPLQTLTAEFDISVLDINEAPSEIVIKEPVTVDENTQPQTFLSEITVEDEEPQQAHFCSVLTTQVPFSVTTTGTGAIQLIVSDLINFEAKKSYNLNISCSDGEFDVHKILQIQINNMNEAPTGILLNGPQALPATVTEKYEVGTLVAEDEDIEQDHIFTVTGANSDLFKIEDGNKLVQVQNIPSDILAQPAPELNITLTVIDTGLSFRQTLTLPISNEDLQKLKLPELTISTNEIAEDAEPGDIVAQISEQINGSLADDISFTIAEDENSMFSIEENNLMLSKNLSFIIIDSVDVRIQAMSKTTQEVQEKIFTLFIKRSDKCYKDGQTCHEDARCVKLNATFHSCQCKEDFQGSGYSCEQVDDCDGNEAKCGLHGECMDDLKSFKCKCQNGYSGPFCEISPAVNDSCTGNKCQNQAVCQLDESDNGYICQCPRGWTGQWCELSVDECLEETDTCGAEGLCIDEHLSYSCNCSELRYGHRCQYYRDTCRSESCDNEDVCIPKQNSLESVCSSAASSVSLMVNCNEDDMVQQCVDRFLHFVEKNGLFSVDNLPQGSFSAFPSTVTPGEQNNVLMRFFVMTKDSVPLSEGQIWEGLSNICTSIDSSNQSEPLYCPTITEAYLEYMFRNATPGPPGPSTSAEGSGPQTTQAPKPVTPDNKASSLHCGRVLPLQLLLITGFLKLLLG